MFHFKRIGNNIPLKKIAVISFTVGIVGNMSTKVQSRELKLSLLIHGFKCLCLLQSP